MLIREIQKEDNSQVAKVIRSVLVEFGVPKVGTAYADSALDDMFEHYNRDKATYFVIEDNNEIVGCAGVAQLDNYDGPVCELQKMYFLESARGKGYGTKMMKICLDEARKFGFKQCYLETMHQMENAQKLYLKTGFNYIDGPMGNTGHYSCPVHMIIDL